MNEKYYLQFESLNSEKDYRDYFEQFSALDELTK